MAPFPKAVIASCQPDGGTVKNAGEEKPGEYPTEYPGNFQGKNMAVYTEVGDDDLIAFVAEYDIGEAVSCKGIAEGIENSNYALATADGNYILTLYEKRVNPDDLPFFLGLMEHLAAAGIACPTPLHGRDGKALRRLCGRPAAIITFLAGMWPRRPTPGHAAELGRALAELHLAGADFPLRRRNGLSVASWRPLVAI